MQLKAKRNKVLHSKITSSTFSVVFYLEDDKRQAECRGGFYAPLLQVTKKNSLTFVLLMFIRDRAEYRYII